MQPTPKKVLIFDLDGTLIDSVPDLAAAINQMLAKFELPLASVEAVRGWVGNGSLVLVERALLAMGGQLAMLDEAHEIFLAQYADCASQETVAYAGVNEGLDRLLAAGFRLNIATNKPERFLPALLTHLGWQDKFDLVLGGDSLSAKKPDPMQLTYICQRLGYTIDECVMIGDSKNDIMAGQAAGMSTLALRYGYNYGEPIDASNPTQAFDDFDDLVAFILTLA